MPKKIISKITNKKENKSDTPKKEVSNVKKLKMLVTIIDRSKTLFYLDLLEQFEVNVQMVLYGKGTANSEMLNLLGLAETFVVNERTKFSFADTSIGTLSTLRYTRTFPT